MTASPVMRDERTQTVENASYRWAYLILSYGLLLATMYRAFVSHESSWDLILLVILGGGVASIYQGKEKVLSQRWGILSLAAVVIALALAVGIVVLRR